MTKRALARSPSILSIAIILSLGFTKSWEEPSFPVNRQRWSEPGFNHLLHLRLAWVNGRFEQLFSGFPSVSPNT